MRFSVRVFGLELLTIEASTEDAEEPDGAELAGGTLGTERIEVDMSSDRFMGFTNGREVAE